MDITITDNHIHVDHINGEGPVKVAEKFHHAGGKRMIIPNKPTWTMKKPFNFKEAMDLVIKYAEKINSKTSVKAYPIVGVHPAELSRLIESGKTIQEAEELVKRGLEYAQKLVIKGEAIGIGEIGRPHYPVEEKEWEAHNRILLYALELAREADCPVQLHTESSTPIQFREFSKMADKANMKRYKVIKHFSGPYVSEDENYGLTPSLIASRDVIKKALERGNRFLMETDYLDDLGRPGAVLGPKTVPRRTREFLEKGFMSLEDAHKIHEDNFMKVYGF
ncbi:MAG TPA: TatD family hydrolase [Methanothermobacter sp.]|nr:deoxyribonuclease [Methanothermobacter sp. MT-2]HHW04687.1 deoxyribonuclease [Methanothermobacter sp.]HOK72835.1 TatD family hydrolase [Methanothermobacter sp.]HOL69080.1 TatD family hydrolase [Methanothermobacter sp.]HPQ04784.1 TatD family hydrolase [Methanothermobacter sp.]